MTVTFMTVTFYCHRGHRDNIPFKYAATCTDPPPLLAGVHVEDYSCGEGD